MRNKWYVYRSSFSDFDREYVSCKQRGPMRNKDDIVPKNKTICQMLTGILSDIDRTPVLAMFGGMFPTKYRYQPGTFIPGSCPHPSPNIIWTHPTGLSALHE